MKFMFNSRSEVNDKYPAVLLDDRDGEVTETKRRESPTNEVSDGYLSRALSIAYFTGSSSWALDMG
jgi:hypothetical protein